MIKCTASNNKNILGLRHLFMLLFLISSQSWIGAQNFDLHHPVHLPPTVCYGNQRNAFFVVPAPRDFLSRLKSGKKTANIEVTYTGFSQQAQTAFQYAVDIWSTIISSPVTIRIDAHWEPLKTGILGSCAPSNYYRMIEGSRDMNKFYPVALAEKIAGRDLNGTGEADMVASFNSSGTTWYYGTDGVPTTNKYDLVTIVLHEICHGLGYVGSMWEDNTSGIGSYGLGSDDEPAIYDKYIGTSAGLMLTDTLNFDNYSTGLAAALQSDKLYFFSNLAYRINSSKYPKLFAPISWNGGSSIYHLDDLRYDNTVNALMTHAADWAEVVHDPGPLSMAMMNEMGWLNTWIKHDSLPDVETLTAPVEIKAIITSDTLIISNTILLHYSTDSFATSVSIPMLPTENPNEYSNSIPLPVAETTVSYYISVTDTFQRVYTSPSGVPATYHTFYYGKDIIKPVIEHQPIPYILTGVDSIDLSALVTDNLGVKSVYIEYLINGVKYDSVLMANDSSKYFSGHIRFSGLTLSVGDSIAYRIVAVDASNQKNKAFNPVQGYYTFKVEAIPTARDEYYNDFNSPSNDFILDGFSITQPPWFYTPGLHSAHPYPSPNVDGKSFNFIAQLRIPMILRTGDAYLQFHEIAIVEPGEKTSVFGSDNFYDYVVVEGSRDGGNTWKIFKSGWDCRAYPDWLARWNKTTDSQGNSTAPADMALYKIRRINLLEDSTSFKGGDTVLIRFRLYSDPYASGWGWAIDNVGIQGIVSAVDQQKLNPENLAIYPNPVSDELTVNWNGIRPEGSVKLNLFNLVGKSVYRQEIGQQESLNNLHINVRDIDDGMYILDISSPSVHLSQKIVVRHE
jgi:hypothetical protein